MNIQEAKRAVQEAGQSSGFAVMAEYPVVFWDSYEHGRIDFAWFRPHSRTLSVVFEIEGSNVQIPSLLKDLRKFHWSGTPHKVVFLYTERCGKLLTPLEAAVAGIGRRLDQIQATEYTLEQPKIVLGDLLGSGNHLRDLAQTEWSGNV